MKNYKEYKISLDLNYTKVELQTLIIDAIIEYNQEEHLTLVGINNLVERYADKIIDKLLYDYKIED